jgi:hypothetical protein
MKLIYLSLFVSTLALAGEHRIVSCKSAYNGTALEIETADLATNVASTKLVAKIQGLFRLPNIGFVQEATLEVPRTQCDFEAQDAALLRCSHVFGPGATLKAKTETGDKTVELQHAELETRRLIGVGQKKLGLRVRFIPRSFNGAEKMEQEYFQEHCTASK